MMYIFLHYFFDRFKVFADYEDYMKCQEKVNALYKVCSFIHNGSEGCLMILLTDMAT